MKSLKSQKKVPPSDKVFEESILLSAPGGFLEEGNLHWRMGQWQATSQRCLFLQGLETIWECAYPQISDIECQPHAYGFGKRLALKIGTHPDGCGSPCLLITPELKQWERLLRFRSLGEPLSETTLLDIAKGMDSVSEQLLWTFWVQGHASLDSLCQMLCVPDSMQVLQKIKEVINPAAKHALGYNILEFKSKVLHPISGKEVCNNWWRVDLLLKEKSL